MTPFLEKNAENVSYGESKTNQVCYIKSLCVEVEKDFADILHSIFFSIEIQLKFVPKVQLTVSIV